MKWNRSKRNMRAYTHETRNSHAIVTRMFYILLEVLVTKKQSEKEF